MSGICCSSAPRPPTSTVDAAPDVATGDGGPDAFTTVALQINELCADDDGFQVDEEGQADDWIEVRNSGTTAVDLAGFTLGEGKKTHRLPAHVLAPGATLLFWADGSPEQGVRHLGFKLPAGGSRVELRDPRGALVDDVTYPALATNEAFARSPDGATAWVRCRYATPGLPNGPRCGPAAPVDLPVETVFAPFAWPDQFPALSGPLVISEAVLNPARFVELVNPSSSAVVLADFELRLAALAPSMTAPAAGVVLEFPGGPSTLAPGARVVVPVTSVQLAAAALGPEGEGVLVLSRKSPATVLQRLEFMRVPAEAALALAPVADDKAAYRLCTNQTPGADNGTCAPVPAREVGDRVNRLLSPDDFRALSEGGTEIDSQAAKFVVDMAAGDLVHFLSSRTWPLHYTFIRERIYTQPHLDRCAPADAAVFDAGWREFSDREYFRSDGRRFLLGTLVRHAGAGLSTVEFDKSDEITAAQMRQAFFAVTARLARPRDWVVRVQSPRQAAALKAIEGTLPVVDTNAPFRGVSLQAVTPGVGYGVLQFLPAAELAHARLGIDAIVVTDDVPNDVPLIGGLITEAFQTPLSHVGVLTRNRGTPDLALRDARQDPRVGPLLGKLVRFEVSGGGFTLREVPLDEAQAFWKAHAPGGEALVPRLDTTVRGVVDLRQRGLIDLPAIGAKAAQLAELMHVYSTDPACSGPVPTPTAAFALPVVHGLEHFAASGARQLFEAARAAPAFATDPAVRAEALARVRAAILAHPVDAAVLSAVEATARAAFGTARFRLRSSSNTEDLPSFSGAGLYTSLSAAVDDPERTIADGLRTVWASLWGDRAFDERRLANVDESQVAMAVLIHQAYDGVERANGVAVSRDIRDPIEASTRYINAQAGEASVTNPAPGVTSEELTFAWWKNPAVTYFSRSSLSAQPILRADEIARLGCLMRVVHDHFQARLDPQQSNPWFTMESEWKLVGPARTLVLKQARPYSFGPVQIPKDCREI